MLWIPLKLLPYSSTLGFNKLPTTISMSAFHFSSPVTDCYPWYPLLAGCLTLAPHYLEWVTPGADPGVVTAPSALVGANFLTPGKACLSSFELQVPAGRRCCSPRQRVYEAAHAAASRRGFRIPSLQRVRGLRSAPPTSLATTCDHRHERLQPPGLTAHGPTGSCPQRAETGTAASTERTELPGPTGGSPLNPPARSWRTPCFSGGEPRLYPWCLSQDPRSADQAGSAPLRGQADLPSPPAPREGWGGLFPPLDRSDPSKLTRHPPSPNLPPDQERYRPAPAAPPPPAFFPPSPGEMRRQTWEAPRPPRRAGPPPGGGASGTGRSCRGGAGVAAGRGFAAPWAPGVAAASNAEAAGPAARVVCLPWVSSASP